MRRLSIAAISALALCSSAMAAENTGRCEDLLVDRLVIDLRADLERVEPSRRFWRTMEDTLLALYGSGRHLISAGELFHELVDQIRGIETKYVDRSAHGGELVGLFRALDHNHGKEAYKDPAIAEAYPRLYGPIQKYFSTVLIAYAISRGGVDPAKISRIVDLGAGTGDTTHGLAKFFPNAQIAALDQSLPMLEKLRQRFPGVTAFLHDFERLPLPFPPNSQDLVVSVCAAGQYLKPIPFLQLMREVRRILAPGGYFLMEFGERGHTSAAFSGQSVDPFLRMLKIRGFKPVIERPLQVNILKRNYYPILVQTPLKAR